MATIDLGKIKFVFRDTYDNSASYVPDDVVTFTDGSVTSSYICKTATSGNNPSSGGTVHANWQFLAKGQATSPTTTQGDVIVRGASADARLAIGTAGQALKVNSSANGLEYGTAGGVIQVKSTTKTDSYSATSNQTVQRITGLSVNITPTSTSNRILVYLSVNVAVDGNYGGQGMSLERSVGGSVNEIAIATGAGSRGAYTLKAVGSGANGRNYPVSHSIMHLDTPVSTAQHTYQVMHYDTDNTNNIYINRTLTDSNSTGYGRYVSNITVMEIASGAL